MISDLDGLQQLVGFTFILTFIGMTSAAGFFLLERTRVAESHRQSVTLAGIICGIAALNYFYMQNIYLDGVQSGAAAFPTAFRYIDWLLTVPLMLLKFPSLLGLGRRGRPVMLTLVGLAVVMVLTGYIGEVNAENQAVHWGFFTVGTLAGLGIFALLATALRELPDTMSESTAWSVRSMGALVLVGWLVYPVGFVLPGLGIDPELRELVYNVADLVNKVGLGMIAYFGGRRALAALAESVIPAPRTSAPSRSLADRV